MTPLPLLPGTGTQRSLLTMMAARSLGPELCASLNPVAAQSLSPASADTIVSKSASDWPPSSPFLKPQLTGMAKGANWLGLAPNNGLARLTKGLFLPGHGTPTSTPLMTGNHRAAWARGERTLSAPVSDGAGLVRAAGPRVTRGTGAFSAACHDAQGQPRGSPGEGTHLGFAGSHEDSPSELGRSELGVWREAGGQLGAHGQQWLRGLQHRWERSRAPGPAYAVVPKGTLELQMLG